MKMGMETVMSHQSTQGATVACVPDAISFAEPRSATKRFLTMAVALGAGFIGGSFLETQMTMSSALTLLFVVFALAGGFLSTWSPCGYSSLSLLRPAGRYTFGSVVRWSPTFLMHVMGYAAGALLLGGLLGLAGWVLFEKLPFNYMVAGLSVLSIGYGLHQFGFLKCHTRSAGRRCRMMLAIAFGLG